MDFLIVDLPDDVVSIVRLHKAKLNLSNVALHESFTLANMVLDLRESVGLTQVNREQKGDSI